MISSLIFFFVRFHEIVFIKGISTQLSLKKIFHRIHLCRLGPEGLSPGVGREKVSAMGSTHTLTPLAPPSPRHPRPNFVGGKGRRRPSGRPGS